MTILGAECAVKLLQVSKECRAELCVAGESQISQIFLLPKIERITSRIFTEFQRQQGIRLGDVGIRKSGGIL